MFRRLRNKALSVITALAFGCSSYASDINYTYEDSSGLPDQSGQNGKYLQTDGSTASWETVTGGVSSVDTTDSVVLVSPTTGDVKISVDQTQITLTSGQVSDFSASVTALVEGYGYLDAEVDPDFNNWDKSTGITISASQVTDFDSTATALIEGYGYIDTESDPVFGLWDKTTGITISASQVSDFDDSATTAVANQDAYLKNTGDNGSGTYYLNRLMAGGVTSVGDSVDSYTKFLCKYNGDDEDTTYTAESGQTVTFGETAQLDDTQTVFGDTSLLLDGDSDYVSIPDSADWSFGSGAFTIDFWVRFSTVQECMFFNHYESSDVDTYLFLASNKLQFYSNNTSIAVYFTVPWIPSQDQWYHVEIDRDASNNWYVFIDGDEKTKTLVDGSYSNALPDVNGLVYWGKFAYNDTLYVAGWMDEARVSNGIARHTSSFSVPTVGYGEGAYSKTHAFGSSTIIPLHVTDSANNMVVQGDFEALGTVYGAYICGNGSSLTGLLHSQITDFDSAVTGLAGSIDHNSLLNTHNLTTDIDHDALTNTHNLSTDIDHDGLTNTHNLTTDIDHNALTNYDANRHFLVSDITCTGDVTGTIGATIVGNDSHAHTGSTISGLAVADFTSANISNWTNDSGYITVDATLTGDVAGTLGATVIQADSVALGTDTTGNYVASVATTSPITGGAAGSEGATLTLAIADAVANGSTKGAASFTANDFNSSSGNISLDYANGQAATSTQRGFLTDTDWTTFNNKGSCVDNLIINGEFNIFQRGTSFTSVTTPANNDDTYLADRWILLGDGNDSVDVTQQADAPTGMKNSIRLDVETANKKFGILQIIENLNCRQIIGGTASVSFYCKTAGSGKLNNVKVAVLSWSSTSDAPVSDIVSNWGANNVTPTWAANWTSENTPANVNPTTSWAQYKVEGIAIDTASCANVAVFIWSDVTDNTVGDFLYITGVKLENNATMTPYKSRPYQQELKLCQRYYEVIAFISNSYGMVAYSVSIGISFSDIFSTVKFAIPTATIKGTWGCSRCTQPSVIAISNNCFRIGAYSTATGDMYFLTDSADDGITAESEL